MEKTKQKIYVGLSGGVDSSVAATLLKQQGYDVSGIFIKIWSEKWGPCGWKEDRKDAIKTALHLKIPFKELDLSEEYEKKVVDYMIKEYKTGRTPNPDVVCNSQVKFGDFLKWARKQGADFIATGHYVRLGRKITNSKFQIPYPTRFAREGRRAKKSQIINSKFQRVLLAGEYKAKDQSYFLWQLTQSQLKHCLFPIGSYAKPQVRALAKKFGLPTAEKKDSQGICFVGKVGIKNFLQKYIKAKQGKVLNNKGEVIGEHDGAVFYTIGQRHGFVITEKGTDDKPYYVIRKDMRRNTITAGPQKSHGIASSAARDIIIHKVNWISDAPMQNKKYKARYRHLQELLYCSIAPLLNGEYKVIFDKPQEGVAAGQSLVIYDGEICLGGGVIKDGV